MSTGGQQNSAGDLDQIIARYADRNRMEAEAYWAGRHLTDWRGELADAFAVQWRASDEEHREVREFPADQALVHIDSLGRREGMDRVAGELRAAIQAICDTLYTQVEHDRVFEALPRYRLWDALGVAEGAFAAQLPNRVRGWFDAGRLLAALDQPIVASMQAARRGVDVEGIVAHGQIRGLIVTGLPRGIDEVRASVGQAVGESWSEWLTGASDLEVPDLARQCLRDEFNSSNSTELANRGFEVRIAAILTPAIELNLADMAVSAPFLAPALRAALGCIEQSGSATFIGRHHRLIDGLSANVDAAFIARVQRWIERIVTRRQCSPARVTELVRRVFEVLAARANTGLTREALASDLGLQSPRSLYDRPRDGRVRRGALSILQEFGWVLSRPQMGYVLADL